MQKFLVLKSAIFRIESIHQYTLGNWGKQQADAYIDGLFDTFKKIAEKQVSWRSIPAEFEVSGFFYKYQKHFIYFRELRPGQVGITTVLHERMHQIDRFKDDFQ